MYLSPTDQALEKMDMLPLERIHPSTATFDFVAIDFTGVFTVYEGTTPQKCYVMVVADLVTRFVSVEVVSSMSTAVC